MAIESNQQAPIDIEEIVSSFSTYETNKQIEIAEKLGNLYNPRVLEPLFFALEANHWKLRVVAAKSLGKLGYPEAVNPLLKGSKHMDKNTQIASIEALGKFKNPEVAEHLINLYRSLYDQETKVATLNALGKFSDNENAISFVRSAYQRESHLANPASSQATPVVPRKTGGAIIRLLALGGTGVLCFGVQIFLNLNSSIPQWILAGGVFLAMWGVDKYMKSEGWY
jgi:HEAT repeat protein